MAILSSSNVRNITVLVPVSSIKNDATSPKGERINMKFNVNVRYLRPSLSSAALSMLNLSREQSPKYGRQDPPPPKPQRKYP